MFLWMTFASILLCHVAVSASQEIEPLGHDHDEDAHVSYNQMYNSVEHFWSYCGHMHHTFDPERYICCKDYVRPLLAPRHLSRCCGSLTYNRRTHWCCNGKIRRNYLNSVYAKPRCCGRSSYDPDNEMCCDNVVVSANKESSSSLNACCGRRSYNPFRMTCCSTEVQELVGGFWYTQCCGTRSIDTRNTKCCNGTPKYTRNPQNTVCCGDTLINPETEKCCSNEQISSIWKQCPNIEDVNNL